MELGPVVEQDRECVPAAQAQPVQAPGEVACPLAPLRPGERLRIALRADRDAVAKGGVVISNASTIVAAFAALRRAWRLGGLTARGAGVVALSIVTPSSVLRRSCGS